MAGGTSDNDDDLITAINVTPLVDVVLVLLIIFMVITPMLQRGKDVHLPKATKQADGSFKSSATFDLEASITEYVRGKGIATFPNAPPGSAMSDSAQVKPRTRVTAYIVEESRRSEAGREMRRLSGARPADRLHFKFPVKTQREAGSAAPATQATFQAEVLSPPFRQPQSAAPQRLKTNPSSSAAKETFQRKKPHVNVP